MTGTWGPWRGECGWPSNTVPFVCIQEAIIQEHENMMSQSSYLEQWRKHSAALRDKLQVPHKFAPYTSSPHVRLIGVPKLERVRDVLDLAWIKRNLRLQKEHRRRRWAPPTVDELKKDFFCNMSQACQRNPESVGMTAFQQSAFWYSFEKDMVVTPSMMFRIMGYPRTFQHAELSQSQLTSLVGEGFHLACFSLAFLSYLGIILSVKGHLETRVFFRM